jgi:hypothetical protein
MIELATTKEQLKMTKSARIRSYVALNPKAKSSEVAEAIGVTPAYVATVMWTAKKKAKIAKKLGGMQKKKAMTNKELVDLSPALKFLEGRAQVKKEDWNQLGLFSSNAPLVKPKLRMQSAEGDRMIEMFEPKTDAVNHPAHYKVGGIETIDFIEAKKLNYNIGNVVKYLTRADHKGNKLEDLRKAQWYLTREINALK